MIVRSDPARPSVILIGPPGAGKSTIGRKLARELGVSLYDTDAGIEEETGRSIPDIFATDGEPEFRRIEERVVRRAILAEHGVVSLGGGAVLSERTRDLLRGRTVVYLEISIAEGLRRTGASTNRPLLNGDDPSAKYRELMRVRRPLYREVASIRIRTDGRSPGRVVRAILGKLGIEPTEPSAPQPDSSRAEGTGSRRSRSRGRRRRSRPAAAAPSDATGGNRASEATEPTAELPATQADSPETERPQPRRRARRSRRGGRRHTRHRAAPPSDPATDLTASPRPAPATAENGPGAAAKPGGAMAHSRSGRIRRSASRAAGPPAPPATNPAARTTHAATRSDVSRSAATPSAPAPPSGAGASTAEAVPTPNRTRRGGERSDHDAAPGAGRSRRARARRARLRRALEESEQHT